MYRKIFPWALLIVATVAWAVAVSAADNVRTMGLPSFTADGKLQPPAGYDHWVFLTSDLGMSYNEHATEPGQPPFSNVFVDPAAWDVFKRTGTWPEHTQLIKEFRASATRGSINQHGFFQQGAAVSVLVHVKDSSRFKGGWGFFVFNGSGPRKPARMLPATATCYSCHRAHGAVDSTFVQFYPDLLPIARRDGTLAPGYRADPAHGTHAAH